MERNPKVLEALELIKRQQSEPLSIEDVPSNVVKKVRAALGNDHSYNHKESRFMALVEQYMLQHRCKKIDALKACTVKYPDEHRRYLQQANPGKKI